MINRNLTIKKGLSWSLDIPTTEYFTGQLGGSIVFDIGKESIVSIYAFQPSSLILSLVLSPTATSKLKEGTMAYQIRIKDNGVTVLARGMVEVLPGLILSLPSES